MRTRSLIAMGSGALLAAAAGWLVRKRKAERKTLLGLWRSLEMQPVSGGEHFREEMTGGLPDPARRYLLHAIQPGTRLARTAALEMGGAIRLSPQGPWQPMAGREVLAPPFGFAWQAQVRRGLRRFSKSETYAGSQAVLSSWLWGWLPLARAGGEDISRSARGRLAIESIWNPAALLPQRGANWQAVDDQSVRLTLIIDGEPVSLTMQIEPDGSLATVTMLRWGNPAEKGGFDWLPFGLEALEERTFDGYTIPTQLQAGWWFGAPNFYDCFHPVIERATFQ